MNDMRTASAASKTTEASEQHDHLSLGLASLQIDELVEIQDDQGDRPRTVPERRELQSAGLSSLHQDEIGVNRLQSAGLTSLQQDQIEVNGANYKIVEIQNEPQEDDKSLYSIKSVIMVRIIIF